ncbi:hypothetical protein POV27_11545 [Aureisphaera galaxeae]|uniref:hypothetical protein n=1 Tax=Aureisphaera galaxeae TaxID=1538023 RepID=UPI00234FEDB0|nr:hypothetical protein [Aureisphaera galaxeae]MDC8004686.1 hypothetical protein [Aureisphaera galaxeae]
MKFDFQRNQSFPYFAEGTEDVFYDISEINKREAKQETVVQVETAKVVFANYPLLMHDFPQLSETELLKRNPSLATMHGKKRTQRIHNLIDKWLLRHGGYVSTQQAKGTTVNSKIETGSNQTNAYRPPHYGRALVFSIQDTITCLGPFTEIGEQMHDKGLLDIKGVGVAPDKTPSNKTHSSGLMPLRGCYKELFIEQLIHQIFRHEKSNHRTTPIYAIVDLGFDRTVLKTRIEEAKGKLVEEIETLHQPSGLLFRRAHNRVVGNVDLPKYGSQHYELTKEIELMLRKYGMTSASTPSRLMLCPKEDGFDLWHGRFKQNELKDGAVKNYLSVVSKKIPEPVTFDGINVQLTGELRSDPLGGILVDFDHYHIHESFENPILFMSAKYMCWGDLCWPHHKGFVQPNKHVSIPYHLLEGEGEVMGFPEYELIKRKIITLCEGLVKALRDTTLSDRDVIQILEGLFKRCIKKW